MKYEYNDPILKPRRKELRNKATEAEKALWERLQHNQLNGFKFVRQYSVGPYILDFFCSKVRLAIELDGHQHASKEGRFYDEERASYLEGHDIKIVRFWNEEIINDLEKVVEKILRLLPPS